MKSKLLIAIFVLALSVGVLLTNTDHLTEHSCSASFRTQMRELVQLKNAGLISEEEYRQSHRSLFSRMIH